MPHSLLLELASVIVLGIAAQWTAWRLRMPAILPLLAFGLTAGPVTGWLHPDHLFGELLLPFVSLSVAVLLYEGGLSLKLGDLREVTGVFLRLTTLGVLVTWLVGAVAAHYLLDFEWRLAAILGAVLVVTGPTVIGPLIRHLRLGGIAGSILKWEGIIIDPVGATLAVLVFTAVGATEVGGAAATVVLSLLRTATVGIGLGGLGAALFVLVLRRYWIPDSLHNPVSLMVVVGVFAMANALQEEAGLLAVTVMGIVLANQKWVPIKHLTEFKENLGVLLTSCLFIILSARLRREDLAGLNLSSLLFLASLVFLARPLSVFVATVGSTLTLRERLFLAWMAPRGIVAAAVASVFALQLAQAEHPQAARLVPITFLVIIGTVAIYGLTAPPLARWLGLARPNPQGILFVGGHGLARALARALQDEGYSVLVADSEWSNLSAARNAGLPVYYGSVLSEHALEEIDFTELGRLVALTPNNEVNSLACMRFLEFFGRREVYQLPFGASSEGRYEAVPAHQRGRFLFGAEVTYEQLVERFGESPQVKATRLTPEFDYEAFRARNGDNALPVLLLKEKGGLVLSTSEETFSPRPGQTLVSLVVPSSTGAGNSGAGFPEL